MLTIVKSTLMNKVEIKYQICVSHWRQSFNQLLLQVCGIGTWDCKGSIRCTMGWIWSRWYWCSHQEKTCGENSCIFWLLPSIILLFLFPFRHLCQMELLVKCFRNYLYSLATFFPNLISSNVGQSKRNGKTTIYTFAEEDHCTSLWQVWCIFEIYVYL